MFRSSLTSASVFRASLTRTQNSRCFSAASYQHILTERRGGVGLVTLNRPKALNALCDDLINELNAELQVLDQDPEVGAIVITGSEKAFAAGADIKEMCNKTAIQASNMDMLSHWNNIVNIKKPTIAAVNGFALGGGCELAMMCDVIVAGHKAKFGQPEVKLGTIPGCGGTQRLTRAVGKSKAMELILTGDMVDAEWAERSGLASRVFPAENLVDEAVKMGQKMASFSQCTVRVAKEAVNSAYNSTLDTGIIFERRLFHATFASHDQKEGMTAFAEKRDAQWKHE